MITILVLANLAAGIFSVLCGMYVKRICGKDERPQLAQRWWFVPLNLVVANFAFGVFSSKAWGLDTYLFRTCATIPVLLVVNSVLEVFHSNPRHRRSIGSGL